MVKMVNENFFFENLKDGNKFNGICHAPFFSLSNIFDFLFVSKEKEFFQLK